MASKEPMATPLLMRRKSLEALMPTPGGGPSEDSEVQRQAFDRLRKELAEYSFLVVLAWWHSSETAARRRTAETAGSAEIAVRASKKARRSAEKIRTIRKRDDLDTLTEEERDMIVSLADTALSDAEAAEDAVKVWLDPSLQVTPQLVWPPPQALAATSSEQLNKDEDESFLPAAETGHNKESNQDTPNTKMVSIDDDLLEDDERDTAGGRITSLYSPRCSTTIEEPPPPLVEVADDTENTTTDLKEKNFNAQAHECAEEARRHLASTLKSHDGMNAVLFAKLARDAVHRLEAMSADVDLDDIEARVAIISCALRAATDAIRAERHVNGEFGMNLNEPIKPVSIAEVSRQSSVVYSGNRWWRGFDENSHDNLSPRKELVQQEANTSYTPSWTSELASSAQKVVSDTIATLVETPQFLSAVKKNVDSEQSYDEGIDDRLPIVPTPRGPRSLVQRKRSSKVMTNDDHFFDQLPKKDQDESPFGHDQNRSCNFFCELGTGDMLQAESVENDTIRRLSSVPVTTPRGSVVFDEGLVVPIGSPEYSGSENGDIDLYREVNKSPEATTTEISSHAYTPPRRFFPSSVPPHQQATDIDDEFSRDSPPTTPLSSLLPTSEKKEDETTAANPSEPIPHNSSYHDEESLIQQSQTSTEEEDTPVQQIESSTLIQQEEVEGKETSIATTTVEKEEETKDDDEVTGLREEALASIQEKELEKEEDAEPAYLEDIPTAIQEEELDKSEQQQSYVPDSILEPENEGDGDTYDDLETPSKQHQVLSRELLPAYTMDEYLGIPVNASIMQHPAEATKAANLRRSVSEGANNTNKQLPPQKSAGVAPIADLTCRDSFSRRPKRSKSRSPPKPNSRPTSWRYLFNRKQSAQNEDNGAVDDTSSIVKTPVARSSSTPIVGASR